MTVPFRWNVDRREQLGGLVDGPPEGTYDGFEDELIQCCVRIMAMCDDSDLVFVGRSPENMFDYLSGVLAGTSWAGRCTLVNVSFRRTVDQAPDPDVIRLLRDHFAAIGIRPETLARGRSTALVDLVAGGSTFGRLATFLLDWARDNTVDPAAVKRQLRFLGITERMKNSPNTWRWFQQAEWAREFPSSSTKSISVPYRTWIYLGNYQRKVSQSNPPWRWGSYTLAHPSHKSWQLRALSLAVTLYDLGNDSVHRRTFATRLAAEPEMSYPWYRRLVGELRGTAGRR